jgi:hypothetical protein
MGNSYSNQNSYTVIECNHTQTPKYDNQNTSDEYDIISQDSSTPSTPSNLSLQSNNKESESDNNIFEQNYNKCKTTKFFHNNKCKIIDMMKNIKIEDDEIKITNGNQKKSANCNICDICNIEKAIVNGQYVCIGCGETENAVFISMDNQVDDAENTKKENLPYKKINHITEKLAFLHSPQNNDNIPENIYDLIKAELKNKGINNEDAKINQIKLILKKHRQTNYYKHLYEIYHKITNKQPYILSAETHNIITSMFSKVSKIYPKYTPPGTGFLSYDYVIHKLFKIIGLNNIADFFHLLKSKEKLKHHDDIWKKICEYNGWKFHSSF